jgi:hypothetical protein
LQVSTVIGFLGTPKKHNPLSRKLNLHKIPVFLNFLFGFHDYFEKYWYFFILTFLIYILEYIIFYLKQSKLKVEKCLNYTNKKNHIIVNMNGKSIHSSLCSKTKIIDKSFYCIIKTCIKYYLIEEYIILYNYIGIRFIFYHCISQ